LFERWFLHYKELLMAREKEADRRAFALRDERRSLLLQRTFAPEPQRYAAEARLKQIALEIADLYRTGRPAAPAAQWVIE
jgi:hypothetical protein